MMRVLVGVIMVVALGSSGLRNMFDGITHPTLNEWGAVAPASVVVHPRRLYRRRRVPRLEAAAMNVVDMLGMNASVCEVCEQPLDDMRPWRRGRTSGLGAHNDCLGSDACPESGRVDCQMCSGEMCAEHGFDPCDCDSAERHVGPFNPQPVFEPIGVSADDGAMLLMLAEHDRKIIAASLATHVCSPRCTGW